MFFIVVVHPVLSCFIFFFFFFNDTATTEIYTLSLHDALPIRADAALTPEEREALLRVYRSFVDSRGPNRSEEHTSELQSHSDLVCRLLLEKKKKPRKLREHAYKHTCATGNP